MAQDVTGITRFGDRSISVPPSAIESELSRIWVEAQGGGDVSSVRLRVLNLVALGPEMWTVERWERVVESLATRHPCRAILAVVSPDQQQVEASISARCWLGVGGGVHVCSEEVVLRGNPAQAGALASTILALLVPDLPVVVWVIGDIDPRLPHVGPIIALADTVLADSADNFDAHDGLRSALNAHRDYDVPVRDLAWQRTSAWRWVIAQFFDGVLGAARLERLDAIEVRGGRGGPSSDALLVAGWLTSRLGMSIADLGTVAGGIRATLYESTRGVRLNVTSAPDGERIAGVTLHVGDKKLSVELHHPSHLRVYEDDGPEGPMERIIERDSDDDASLFDRALDDSDDSRIFIDALRAAVDLVDG